MPENLEPFENPCPVMVTNPQDEDIRRSQTDRELVRRLRRAGERPYGTWEGAKKLFKKAYRMDAADHLRRLTESDPFSAGAYCRLCGQAWGCNALGGHACSLESDATTPCDLGLCDSCFAHYHCQACGHHRNNHQDDQPCMIAGQPCPVGCQAFVTPNPGHARVRFFGDKACQTLPNSTQAFRDYEHSTYWQVHFPNLQTWEKVRDSLGLEDFLGEGAFAHAFLSRDGRVYKFTFDRNDAWTAESRRAMGSKVDDVLAVIYQVRKCGWQARNQFGTVVPVYLIVAEALHEFQGWHPGPGSASYEDLAVKREKFARLREVGIRLGSPDLFRDAHDGNWGLRVPEDVRSAVLLDFGLSGAQAKPLKGAWEKPIDTKTYKYEIRDGKAVRLNGKVEGVRLSRFLSLAKVESFVPLMEKRGVSEVARSARGFLTAYRRAGSPGNLPPDWLQKREAFIARHMAQVKQRGERLYEKDGTPTRRHLALIAWAYSPDEGDLRPHKNPDSDLRGLLRAYNANPSDEAFLQLYRAAERTGQRLADANGWHILEDRYPTSMGLEGDDARCWKAWEFDGMHRKVMLAMSSPTQTGPVTLVPMSEREKADKDPACSQCHHAATWHHEGWGACRSCECSGFYRLVSVCGSCGERFYLAGKNDYRAKCPKCRPHTNPSGDEERRRLEREARAGDPRAIQALARQEARTTQTYTWTPGTIKIKVAGRSQDKGYDRDRASSLRGEVARAKARVRYARQHGQDPTFATQQLMSYQQQLKAENAKRSRKSFKGQEVAAELAGPWAVQAMANRAGHTTHWNVTHVGTGFALGSFPTKESAKHAVEVELLATGLPFAGKSKKDAERWSAHEFLAAARCKLRSVMASSVTDYRSAAPIDVAGRALDAVSQSRATAHLAEFVYNRNPSLWQSPDECLAALQAGIVS